MYNVHTYYYKWYTLLQKKIWERHDAIARNPGFSARHMQIREMKKYAADFAKVYNKAWAGHGGLKELSQEQVLLMFKKMKKDIKQNVF